MKITPSRKASLMFGYFSQCQDSLRLPLIGLDPDGYSALECFYYYDTHGGELLPCREPILLSRALNGKERHGLTVTMLAEDYVDRILFSEDLLRYPEWVRRDVLGRAGQVAMDKLGWAPCFVKTGEDFSIRLRG